MLILWGGQLGAELGRAARVLWGFLPMWGVLALAHGAAEGAQLGEAVPFLHRLTRPQVHPAGRPGDEVPPTEWGGPRGACGWEPTGQAASLQEGVARPLAGRPGSGQPEAGRVHCEGTGR